MEIYHCIGGQPPVLHNALTADHSSYFDGTGDYDMLIFEGAQSRQQHGRLASPARGAPHRAPLGSAQRRPDRGPRRLAPRHLPGLERPGGGVHARPARAACAKGGYGGHGPPYKILVSRA
jgi:hypothetical protein